MSIEKVHCDCESDCLKRWTKLWTKIGLSSALSLFLIPRSLAGHNGNGGVTVNMSPWEWLPFDLGLGHNPTLGLGTSFSFQQSLEKDTSQSHNSKPKNTLPENTTRYTHTHTLSSSVPKFGLGAPKSNRIRWKSPKISAFKWPSTRRSYLASKRRYLIWFRSTAFLFD